MKDKLVNDLVTILVIAVIIFGFWVVKNKIDREKTDESDIYTYNEVENSSNNPEKAYLIDQGGDRGFGISKRIASGGDFICSINANLPDISSGKFYVAWLKKDTGEIICLGRLAKIDSEYIAVYQSKNTIEKYDTVLVTEEVVDDNQPEQLVLEGQFNH